MKTTIAIIGLWIACSGITSAQTNQLTTNSVSTNSISKQTEKPLTIGGKLVKTVHLDKVQPDGLLVSYTTTDGGFGTKVFYFENFPASVQKQYGYDPKKAADFEASKKEANAQVSQQMIADDDAAKVTIAERNLKDSEDRLKESEDRAAVLKEQYDDEIKEQQLQAAQRAADAQERQANAIEQQNFQQVQTQQKLDDIEWDLRWYKY
jgi:hypothetical protein